MEHPFRFHVILAERRIDITPTSANLVALGDDVLTTLLIGVLYAAPPPTDEGPARIEGLRTTWVSPSTWVPALRPGRPLPQGPVLLAVVVHDASVDVTAIATTLGELDAVEKVDPAEGQLMVMLSAWTDLGKVPLADGRTLADVADLTVVRRPAVALPGSTTSPTHPPGPSPRTRRPFPPPPPPEMEPGWDLVIHNPHLGGPSRLSIETLGLGEVDPDSTVVLHDVTPGIYSVTFETPTGATRTRAIAATERE